MTARCTAALAVACVVASGGVAHARGEAQWTKVVPGRTWDFPADHSGHPGYRTEWWYVTGQVRTEGPSPRRFGYQVTLFRVGVVPERPAFDSRWAASGVVMGHAALTDVEAGRHRFSETLYRQTPFLGGFPAPPDPKVAWCRAPAGTDGEWQVIYDGEGFDFRVADDRAGFSLDLSTVPTKPMVLHGENGFSKKGRSEDAASHYYSYTRLATRGEVVVDGRRHAVSGESWLDREIASRSLSGEQVGWDWFGLQLDDERELMLYLLRKGDGTVDFASGTLVTPAGKALPLAAGAFRVEPQGRWTSPETGAAYPARWRVTLPAHGIDLEIRPLVAGQENRSTVGGGLHYWEGAVEIFAPGGEVPIGRGYVELTGYGEGNRPPV